MLPFPSSPNVINMACANAIYASELIGQFSGHGIGVAYTKDLSRDEFGSPMLLAFGLVFVFPELRDLAHPGGFLIRT